MCSDVDFKLMQNVLLKLNDIMYCTLIFPDAPGAIYIP